MTRAKPDRGAILARIKRLYEDGFFIPRSHFRRRTEQREVSHAVLPSVIEGCHVVRGPEWDAAAENWRVTVRGPTPDGEIVELGLAVELEEEVLFLITAYYVE
jgi:hypothetical protein